MSTLPPQLVADLDAVRRAGAVIAGVRPAGGEKTSREEEMRGAITRELDTQLAEVQRQIDAHRALAGHGGNDPHLNTLEHQSSRLAALRQSAESAPNLIALAQLRSQVTEAVRGAGEAAQAASAAISGGSTGAGSGALAAQRMADATYRAQVAQYSREMAPTMQRVDQHRRADDELGRRYGVDTKPFARVDDELKHKADAARKRGDQPEGIRHDALRGWNSLLRAKTLLDAMPEGPDKEKRKAAYERQLEDQRKAEELRRKSDAAEVENQAKKLEATGKPFASPDERKKWVDQRIQQLETQHKQRQEDVESKSGASPEVRHGLQNDFRQGLNGSPDAPTAAPAASSEPAAQPAGDAAKATKRGFSEAPPPTFDGMPPAGLPDTAKGAVKKAAEPATKCGAKPAGEGDKAASQSPACTPDKKPEAKQQDKN